MDDLMNNLVLKLHSVLNDALELIAELRAKAEAAGREAVEVGRVDLAAVAAEIGKAEIVGEDHDDIGGCGVAAHRCGECQHDW